MGEPKYDEDVVNLGYLKRIIKETADNISVPENISRHYGTKPSPPYYKGDTWIDGNIVYTCINSREIGLYEDSDWVTESGAKEEAEKRNKVFLTKPSNYNIGDMWILQTDNDHKAGKKGEILITTVKSGSYHENDWVNILGYGTITSINEVANNLNNAVNRIGNVEEAIEDGIIVTFYQPSVPEAKHIGDLWYVTETVGEYIKGKIYRYDGTFWQVLNDPEIEKAFSKANEARLVADGKIQSFYSTTEPINNVGVGDLWIDIEHNNNLYRFNGTNWVPVYDTRVENLVTTTESTAKTVAEIQTDLGKVTSKVTTIETTVTKTEKTADEAMENANTANNSAVNAIDLATQTENRLNNDYLTTEETEDRFEVIRQEQKTLSSQFEQTSNSFEVSINSITEIINENNEAVNTRINDINNYLRYEVIDGVGVVTLGRSDSPILLKQKNDRVYFEQNGQEVAYISDNKLFITDGQFLSSLRIGNFAFIPRVNGNLSFRKVSGN